MARAVAPVRMTGNYGSEVLRGVSLFKPLGLPRQMFAPEFVPYIEAAEASLEAATKTHPISFVVFEEIPSSLYGRLAAADRGADGAGWGGGGGVLRAGGVEVGARGAPRPHRRYLSRAASISRHASSRPARMAASVLFPLRTGPIKTMSAGIGTS